MKKIKIARTGTFTDMRGTVVTFSEAFLKGLAESYDPQKRQAPLVKGHPKLDDPAQGWIKSLSYEDGAVFAFADQIDPDFEAEVKAGRYKNVSPEIYMPGAGNNPDLDGKPYLKHLGCLGAKQPAMSGLGSLAFAEGEEGQTVVVSLAEGVSGWAIADIGRAIVKSASLLKGLLAGSDQKLEEVQVLENMGLNLVEQGASTATDQMNEDPEISLADEEPEGSGADKPPASSPKPDTNPKPTPSPEKDTPPASNKDEKMNKELEAERSKLEQERISLAEERKALRKEKLEGRIEAVVESGKLAPAQKALVVCLAEALPEGDEVISFSDGEGEKSLSPTEAFFSLLDGLPEQVSFSERSAQDDNPELDSADADSITAAAKSYIKQQEAKGVVVSFSEAVDHISEGAGQ